VALEPCWGLHCACAYDMLTELVTPRTDTSLELVWHHQVPLKVLVFAWRLLQDRLPTRANLAVRAIIPTTSTYYVSGCGQIETVEHLFLTRSTFGLLWQLVRDWIGFVGVDTNNISDHLLQFTYMTGAGKAKRSFLQLIWLLCS